MIIYQWSQASKSKLFIQVYLCTICIILVFILEINVDDRLPHLWSYMLFIDSMPQVQTI
jgi:hypothetical protein